METRSKFVKTWTKLSVNSTTVLARKHCKVFDMGNESLLIQLFKQIQENILQYYFYQKLIID